MTYMKKPGISNCLERQDHPYWHSFNYFHVIIYIFEVTLFDWTQYHDA